MFLFFHCFLSESKIRFRARRSPRTSQYKIPSRSSEKGVTHRGVPIVVTREARSKPTIVLRWSPLSATRQQGTREKSAFCFSVPEPLDTVDAALGRQRLYCGPSVCSPLSFLCTSTTRPSVAAVVVLCWNSLTVRVCFAVPRARRARIGALCRPLTATSTQIPTPPSAEPASSTRYIDQSISDANQTTIQRIISSSKFSFT